MNKKGIILVLVLGVILVVVIVSMVIISVMLSQTRLTKHQVDRTKAKYAAQAGINYALEMLRIGPAAGGWDYNHNYTLCNNTSAGCSLNNSDLPYKVNITIGSATGCNGLACVNATVNYTYTDR